MIQSHNDRCSPLAGNDFLFTAPEDKELIAEICRTILNKRFNPVVINEPFSNGAAVIIYNLNPEDILNYI